MSADVDIDFADRSIALNVLHHIRASRTTQEGLVAHNTGVYFQPVPFNPVTECCNIDYKEAESRGYFKIDFLNVNVYKGVKDEAHLLRLMEQEPIWDLLEQDDFCNLLFHVNGYGSVLRKLKPNSIEKLAAVLAVLRPAKRHLIEKTWSEILNEVWEKPENDEYYFKKSHAHSYAIAIVVQMNLICEQLNDAQSGSFGARTS